MTNQRKSLSWGVGIWLLYGGFVLFILACVGFASMQHFDLVEDNYYERGIDYQEHINMSRITLALPEQPSIQLVAPELIQLSFPAVFRVEQIRGVVNLYRPSNSRYDRQVPVSIDSLHRMQIPLAGLPKGLWKVKLNWEYDGQKYYNEEVIVSE